MRFMHTVLFHIYGKFYGRTFYSLHKPIRGRQEPLLSSNASTLVHYQRNSGMFSHLPPSPDGRYQQNLYML